MKIPPGNIYSGDPLRAVFTNPTELAFKKGSLRQHYPIYYNKVKFVDVEEAYQIIKRISPWMSFEKLQDLIVDLIEIKLRTYPLLVQTITESGGDDWILACSHFTYAKTDDFRRWEGTGEESAFICCLLKAYQRLSTNNEERENGSNNDYDR